MPKLNIAVMYFPGNNCEVETLRAVKAAGMDGKILRWNTKENIRDFDGFIISGGWAYEDRIRAGVIAAKDPITHIIKVEAEKGKPVLGICNGAQVLVETGMIPGLKNKVEMALAPNKNPFVSGYYNAWIYIKNVQNKARTAYTKLSDKDEILQMPVAHGEGCFITKDKTLIKELKKNKQIIFQYSTKEGKIVDKFPVNPNGSMLNIAAICNKKGNVMAIMPHPERAVWKRQLPEEKKNDTKTNSLKIFESMKKYIS